MKRQFAYSLYFLCLSLLMVGLFSAPVFAYRVDPGCPNPEKMMANPDHSGWKNPMCFLEVSAYVKSLKDKGPAKCQEHGEALQQMFEKNRQKIRDLRVANNPEWDTWFTVRSELLQTCRMADPNYAYVWNAQKRDYVKVPRTRDEVIQKKVEHQTAMAKIMEVLPGWPRPKVWNDTAQANKRVENLQGLLDLMIQKVQAGADLTPFIELIVNEGKPNKQDPHYVSDDVINTAFLLYAYNVPANRADKILKYTNKKYAPRVRFAAASAVAEFAQNSKTRNGLVPNEPSGRLALTDKQREQVLDIFGVVFDNAKTDLTRAVVQYRLKRVYGDVNWMANNERLVAQRKNQAAIGPITLVLTPSLAQMLAAEASAYASSIGASVASGTTALQAALAAPATALTGEVFIGAVPVVIFGMALDDAFAPTYKAAFEHKLREALGVENDGEMTINNPAAMQAALASGIGATAWIKALTSERTDAAVKEQLKNASQCMHFYQPLKKHGAFPMSVQALELSNFILVGDCIPGGSGKYTCPTRTHWEAVKKTCAPEGILEPWNDMCEKEVKELKTVWAQQESFWVQVPTKNGMEDTHNNLYVRAIYRDGKWIPNVEFTIPGQVFAGKMMKFVKMWLENDIPAMLGGADPATAIGTAERILNGKFDPKTLKNDVNLRHGIHDNFQSGQQLRHFHMEKRCSYTPSTNLEYYEECDYRAGNATNLTGKEQYVCNLALYYCTMGGDLAKCAAEMTRMDLLKGW